jgi:anaerobic magnesium-protoporphyrin IX monomethyl ester cyclase
MRSVLKSSHPAGPVVLVMPPVTYVSPFGIMYIAGELLRAGHAVVLLERPEQLEGYQDLAASIMGHKPLFVGISGLLPDLYYTGKLISLLDQQGRNFPVVVGGQMVTPTPEMALTVTGADIGALGEAELTTLALTEALRQGKSPAEVPGFVIREGETFHNTGDGPFYRDLSTLPPIPYDMLNHSRWIEIGKFYVDMMVPHWRYNDRVISIHGGRGCPFKCNFCYHHSVARYRKTDSMMEELDMLLGRYNGNFAYFGDDLVFASPKRAASMCEGLRKLHRRVHTSVSCRFDILEKLDDGLMQELKDTGCRIMGVGVESGSQDMLNVMNKRITVDQIRSGLTRLKKFGFLPTTNIMIGQLDETEEDVNKSIELVKETVRENKNISYTFSIATPFPGSPMFKECIKRGLLKDDFDFYHRHDHDRSIASIVCNPSRMSDTRLLELYAKIHAVYFEEKKKVIGYDVYYLERLRRKIEHINRKVHRYLERKNATSNSLVRIYDKAYFKFHGVLDDLRFKMRGLEKDGRNLH